MNEILNVISSVISLGLQITLIWLLINWVLAYKKSNQIISTNKIYINGQPHDNIVVMDKDNNLIAHINCSGEMIIDNGYKVKFDYKGAININN